MTTPSKRPQSIARQRDVPPLLSRAVRISQDDLEIALADIPNMSILNKSRAHDVLVRGMQQVDVAHRDGCSRQAVAAVVRRVRAALAKRLQSSTMVTAPITLPLGLAEEMRALSSTLLQLKDLPAAEKALRPLLKAIVQAQKAAAALQ